MKKKDILDEVLIQISDLKKDIYDLKKDIKFLLEKENNVVIVGPSNISSFQRIENKICPSCNLDISKGNICCMSTNCPYRMNVTF